MDVKKCLYMAVRVKFLSFDEKKVMTIALIFNALMPLWFEIPMVAVLIKCDIVGYLIHPYALGHQSYCNG